MMPRSDKAPAPSKVQWADSDEKRRALDKVPPGESFSNHVRRKLKLPPLEHGGARSGAGKKAAKPGRNRAK